MHRDSEENHQQPQSVLTEIRPEHIQSVITRQTSTKIENEDQTSKGKEKK
jgi:hypothetical protein